MMYVKSVIVNLGRKTLGFQMNTNGVTEIQYEPKEGHVTIFAKEANSESSSCRRFFDLVEIDLKGCSNLSPHSVKFD